VTEPGLLKSGQKKLQHINRGLHKKLQANNKKIVQFIGVYIRN